MWRRYKHRTHLKHLLLLLAYPLLLSSIGYALFSQNLSINTTTRKPAYTATPGMSFSYTTTKTPSGGLIIYNITATVKNIGTGSVTAWQVKFDLPADYTQFSCGTMVTCTATGPKIVVDSGTGNSTITAGGTATFTFTFRTATQNYQLQNLYVIGVEPSFQPITGLTVSTAIGAQSGDGLLRYKRTYTFTVRNNTGQTVKMWRIRGTPWPTANRVNSMDPGVHYMDLAAELVLIRTNPPLANGGTFVFSGVLSYTNLTWSMTNVTIQGRQ